MGGGSASAAATENIVADTRIPMTHRRNMIPPSIA
jgi:hypothetical protein